MALQVIKAIDGDWAFTDPDDDASCYVLVDADRCEHKRLRPEKAFVSLMEDEGFIEMCSVRGQPRGIEREIMDFGDEKIVVPLVHFFNVTKKGRILATELK